MFELAAGTIDRPFHDKHAVPSIVSVVSHAVVLGSVVGALLFGVSDRFPQVPTMVAFVAEVPAPPPPPPPAPAPRVRAEKEPQPITPAPASGQTFIAPAETPQGIPPENAIDFDGEGGVVGGVPGGIPGGVVGGVPGGVLPDAAPPPPRTPMRIGGDVQAPALVHWVKPDYPPVAVSAKVTGIVVLETTVNEAGQVTNIVVLRSVPILDKSAISAVKQWRYQPLLLNGVPSPFILTVTLTFSLK